MPINITDHYFQYGALKYFRTNAHLVELATFGEKKDPIGAKAYLDPQGKIKASHLAERPIKISPSISIDWDDVKEKDLEGGAVLKFLGLGRKHGVSFDYKKAKSAKLKLLSISIDEGPLTRCLNNDADIVRNAMADEGNDARIASETWFVVEAELAEHIDANFSTNHEWSAFGNSIDLTVTGGKHGSQTITLGAGSTFAYKLHKVKKWNKDKTRIEDMEADYKGFG